MIRSVLAILAGILILTGISFAIEAVANPVLMGLFPHSLPTPDAIHHNAPASAFGFLYGSLSVAAGGYVSARLARRAPLQHALIMGAVQTGLTVWAAFALRDLAPLPNWLISIATTLPAAALGGWWRLRQERRITPAAARATAAGAAPGRHESSAGRRPT